MKNDFFIPCNLINIQIKGRSNNEIYKRGNQTNQRT